MGMDIASSLPLGDFTFLDRPPASRRLRKTPALSKSSDDGFSEGQNLDRSAEFSNLGASPRKDSPGAKRREKIAWSFLGDGLGRSLDPVLQGRYSLDLV
jgi:hypothetical protein